jgi:hypothetical protein
METNTDIVVFCGLTAFSWETLVEFITFIITEQWTPKLVLAQYILNRSVTTTNKFSTIIHY